MKILLIDLLRFYLIIYPKIGENCYRLPYLEIIYNEVEDWRFLISLASSTRRLTNIHFQLL